MVFDCFSLMTVKMGLKYLAGKQALYEMGEGVDELRRGLKTRVNFYRPQGPVDREQEQKRFRSI